MYFGTQPEHGLASSANGTLRMQRLSLPSCSLQGGLGESWDSWGKGGGGGGGAGLWSAWLGELHCPDKGCYGGKGGGGGWDDGKGAVPCMPAFGAKRSRNFAAAWQVAMAKVFPTQDYHELLSVARSREHVCCF